MISTCCPEASVTYSSLPSALSASAAGWLVEGSGIGEPSTVSVVESITTTAGPDEMLETT
jgi:hypothetical protein